MKRRCWNEPVSIPTAVVRRSRSFSTAPLQASNVRWMRSPSRRGWLAIGIAGLVNVLDPDIVVLGGLFARVLPALRSRLDAELADRRYVAARRDVAVVGARLGPLAVTVGAAELAFGPLLDDPAGVMSSSVA